MEELLKFALKAAVENGEITAITTIFLVVGGGAFLRSKNWLGTERSKMVSADQVAGLSQRVEGVEKRLGHVEAQLEHMPKQEEMHRLQISMTRIEGRMVAVEQGTVAVGRQLNRIEDFMIRVSERK